MQCARCWRPTDRCLLGRGYLLTQVAGGVWADRFGGKRILGFGVVWWSLVGIRRSRALTQTIVLSHSLALTKSLRFCHGCR